MTTTTNLGAVSVCFYLVHAGQYVIRRQAENALWVCHVGALLVGVGLLARRSDVTAVGTLWLLVGLPFWIYDLSSGGTFVPTSVLTHVGGLIVGLVGAKRLGVPTGLWWKSVAAMLPLLPLSRWLTPPEANVNLAHRVYPGFESIFPSHALYAVAILSLFAGAGFAFQLLSRRLGCKPPEKL